MVDFSSQKKESNEVYFSSEQVFSLERADIQKLGQIADLNQRRRVRFCAHGSPQESVHEMFIVHPQETYVRPHKHLNKAESMLVLEGDVDYVIFDEVGNIEDVLPMGEFRSGKPFYQTVRKDLYHTLIIHSEWLFFLEITKGPFEKKDTVFAQWSPEDSDIVSVKQFSEDIMRVLQC